MGLAFPFLVHAQTPPEISGILERLDKLERENRALTEEVKALRARLDGGAPANVADDSPRANTAVENGPPPLTVQVCPGCVAHGRIARASYRRRAEITASRWPLPARAPACR